MFVTPDLEVDVACLVGLVALLLAHANELHIEHHSELDVHAFTFHALYRRALIVHLQRFHGVKGMVVCQGTIVNPSLGMKVLT